MTGRPLHHTANVSCQTPVRLLSNYCPDISKSPSLTCKWQDMWNQEYFFTYNWWNMMRLTGKWQGLNYQENILVLHDKYCCLSHDLGRRGSIHVKILYYWQEINLAMTGNWYYIIFFKHCQIVHKNPCFWQVFSPFLTVFLNFAPFPTVFFLVYNYFFKK